MFEVELGAAADQAFDNLTTVAQVGVLHKLTVIEQNGVLHEQKIAEIDSNYLVHLLDPSTQEKVVTIWRTLSAGGFKHEPILVTHICRLPSLDHFSKQRLAQEAASELGIFPMHIQIF
jgi:hypothetical protein